ncbi:hypothetical protein HDU79_006385 [Rhizoclosmatium sp. JEL0117]|nr:hypothetical protein HDU79_006385 [Rhizoclosmatium sp. JEL0117]
MVSKSKSSSSSDAEKFLESIGVSTNSDHQDVSPELAKAVKSDAPLLVKSLNSLIESITSTKSKLNELKERIRSETLPTSKGVSLLEVKLHGLLSYLTNLSFFILLKLQGHSTAAGHPALDKLIELRVVLEKMKPIEAKLKYQIDKVVKAANEADGKGASKGSASGTVVGWEGEEVERKGVSEYELQAAGVSDPLQFKPNPRNLVGAMSLDPTAPTYQDEPGSGVYRPPKIAPTKYTEDNPKKKSQLSQQTRESLSKSRLFRDMREAFDTARPEQVTSHGTGYGLRELRDAKDEELQKIEDFELDNYQRLGATRDRNKREKAAIRRSGTSGIVDEMENLETDFLHMESLDRAVSFDDKQRYGAGLLAKRNQRAEAVFGEGDESGARKRKHMGDADEMLRFQSKQFSSKTGYDKAIRKMTRPSHKKRK